MATTVIGGMLAATIIAIFLIPVTYYVVERFAANRQQRAPHGVPAGESGTAIGMILSAPTKLRGALREPSRFSRKSASRRCRGWPTRRAVAGLRTVRAASVVALALALISLIIASLGSTSIIILLFATVLLQVAIQAVSVLNQIRLFAVDVNARSRLNTAFVTSNFIGGAISSSLGGVLWQSGGWFSLTAGAAVLIGLALIVWLTQREQALALVQLRTS